MYSISYIGLDVVGKSSYSNGTLNNCRGMLARLINKAQKAVSPSVDSAQAAVKSKASLLLTQSKCPGFGLCGDLLDGEDEDVWPITAITVHE